MQKTITYNRANHDFDMFLDGRHVGSRERHIEAEVELDRLAYEAAAHDAGPVDMAVEGALERLAMEHSQAARLADQLGDKAHRKAERAATTAFSGALIEYKAGVRPELLASGAWLLPSRRAGEAPHIVRMDGDWVCSCCAGANIHWPIALIVGIEVANDDMERFDDGDADEELARLAAPLIDALDTLDGDADFEADCDEPAQRAWRIGAVLGRRIADARARVYVEAA